MVMDDAKQAAIFEMHQLIKYVLKRKQELTLRLLERCYPHIIHDV